MFNCLNNLFSKKLPTYSPSMTEYNRLEKECERLKLIIHEANKKFARAENSRNVLSKILTSKGCINSLEQDELIKYTVEMTDTTMDSKFYGKQLEEIQERLCIQKHLLKMTKISV